MVDSPSLDFSTDSISNKLKMQGEQNNKKKLKLQGNHVCKYFMQNTSCEQKNNLHKTTNNLQYIHEKEKLLV